MLSSDAFSSPTSTVFEGLHDELRDARRVLSQGQEEDLRCALDRVLNKVEELSSLLKTAIKTQTELETQLNLARSNLQLVISNNEMLEEALKRETPYSARDVGWRRWSAREVQNHKTDEERHQSLDYGPLNEGGTPTVPSTVAAILVNGVRPASPSTVQPTTPMTTQESRFFRFRFSSGTRSPALSPHPSHLTSPSLSSLVPNAREKEFEELQEQLEQERQAHKAAGAAKAALEAELESLSQALFEEVVSSLLIQLIRLNTSQANKMVATERMKRAETEEELVQTRLEKDALHQALKLIEGENGRLRSAKAPLDMPSDQTDQPETSPPRCSSPDLPSPRASTGPPTREVTPLTAPSYEIPRHLANFVLRPAPKPSLAGLHRKSLSIESSGTASLSASSPKGPLPSIAASPSVPLMPDEPSPWADVAS
ncbi:hypothetical protein JVT61DRAFT_3081 [Boletus reticuloceps]|uniref:GDP/GTP exchange factor Sec2 N-terminal domain-containing protein n=1 Tax=Boletus reticuloceps TaxID=495285 RepID=A0A8I2YPI8_9AGAM|nr:hypothetical protein JVT61DRAFT_3081 [Boletus reticuloceps]